MALNILRVRVVDKDDGDVLNVETDLVTLPDHPDFQAKKFDSLLDALGAFFEANPHLKQIDVHVVGDK